MTDLPPPKPTRRMKQPKKDVLRERIRQLNIDLNNLRAENEYLRRPWWRRIFRARAA